MEFIRELFMNKAFLAGLLGWAVAQVAKTIMYAIINRKLQLERLVGAGGMPSCHSAMVSGLASATGILYGAGSIEFAISLCLAIIVMYDAMNVRMETGRQGKVLNDMIEIFQKMGKNISPEERLKELVGHTPFQVVIGAVIGVLVGIIVVRYM